MRNAQSHGHCLVWKMTENYRQVTVPSKGREHHCLHAGVGCRGRLPLESPGIVIGSGRMRTREGGGILYCTELLTLDDVGINRLWYMPDMPVG